MSKVNSLTVSRGSKSMTAFDPLAKNRAMAMALMEVRTMAELNHLRMMDGECPFLPPCSSCVAIGEIDKLLAYLADEAARYRAGLMSPGKV